MSNRLFGSSVYLCGSMDNTTDGGNWWRDQITPWLQKRGVFVLNPCKKPIPNSPDEFVARNYVNQLKEEGRFDEIRPLYGESVRGLDLRLVDMASFLIWYLDLNVFTTGSYEEAIISNLQKKPVCIVCPQGKKKLSNWWFYALPHQLMHSSFDELHSYLEYIDSAEEIDTLNRWKFLDWKRLFDETFEACGYHKQTRHLRRESWFI